MTGASLIWGSWWTGSPLIWGSWWPGSPLIWGSGWPGSPLIWGSRWPGPPLSEGLDDRGLPCLRVSMTGASLIWGSRWPGPPLSEGMDPPLVFTSILRECDVLLVATWNYASGNLEVGYNQFSLKMVSWSLQERDPTWVDSRKQPPPIIHRCIFAFWVAANGRFNCGSKFHILKNKRRPQLKSANLDANWSFFNQLLFMVSGF